MIHRHRMLTRLVVIGALAMSLSASALAQSTQPSAPQQSGRRGGAAPANRGAGRVPITRDERAAGEAWASENMPNLAKILQELQPLNPRRIRLGNFAVNHMKTMEDAKRDPQLLEKVKETMKAEDEIFGYSSQLDQATAEDQVVLRSKIRERMKSIVGNVFEERETRIENLKARLEAEEKRLAADKANLEQIVANRLRNMAIDASQSDAAPGAPPSQFNAMQNNNGN